MAEELNVSRVTVRKALDILETEGLIIREVGNGTIIRFSNKAHSGSLNMITLVAPAKNPFFSDFIEAFQKESDAHDSLVLYMQKPKDENLEDSLYRLYQRNLHNVVVWLDDIEIDKTKLQILRALGMNMVFFDTNLLMPFMDCVSLNNNKAILDLYNLLLEKNNLNIAYLGWDNKKIFAVDQREKAYLNVNPHPIVLPKISWCNKKNIKEQIKNILNAKAVKNIDAIICADGEIGNALSSILLQINNVHLSIATVDELPHYNSNIIACYQQNFKKTASVVYNCLKKQNNKSNEWIANYYPVSGQLKINI